MFIILPFIHFWLHHPALLYGIAFLLGLFCYFEGSYYLILPCLSLWIPLFFAVILYRQKNYLKLLSLSLFTFFTAWGISAIHYSFPSIPHQGISGKAHVKIKSIGIQHTLFGIRWVYRCELEQFFPEHSPRSIVSSLPCLISFSAEQKNPRFLADQDYWIQGRLVESNKGIYFLKISSKSSWTAIPGSWSLAEMRYHWKKEVSKWIESQFSNPLSAIFLSGLVTGEFNDYWTREQFARFGLLHLLAISGFHFAIIAGFLSFILQLFLSPRTRIASLLLGMAIYCFFLGPQASILRAWIMCSLTLFGGLIDKQTTALNSLGFALLVILGYNPHLCQEIGFQLSFATTAAILLFYQPIQEWLYDLLPKRRLSEVMQMSIWNQHGYCLLAFLRKSLALSLAVNVFALPLSLYYFHQFPLMSLLYNLFFPFFASGSLCLLLLGGLFAFLPFIAKTIHHFNDAYTHFLLQLTYQVPSEIDAYLTSESFHPFWLILYFCCTILGGIVWKVKSTDSSQSEIFNFI